MKKRAKNPQFNHAKKELFKPLTFDQVFKQPLCYGGEMEEGREAGRENIVPLTLPHPWYN